MLASVRACRRTHLVTLAFDIKPLLSAVLHSLQKGRKERETKKLLGAFAISIRSCTCIRRLVEADPRPFQRQIFLLSYYSSSFSLFLFLSAFAVSIYFILKLLSPFLYFLFAFFSLFPFLHFFKFDFFFFFVFCCKGRRK